MSCKNEYWLTVKNTHVNTLMWSVKCQKYLSSHTDITTIILP